VFDVFDVIDEWLRTTFELVAKQLRRRARDAQLD